MLPLASAITGVVVDQVHNYFTDAKIDKKSLLKYSLIAGVSYVVAYNIFANYTGHNTAKDEVIKLFGECKQNFPLLSLNKYEQIEVMTALFQKFFYTVSIPLLTTSVCANAVSSVFTKYAMDAMDNLYAQKKQSISWEQLGYLKTAEVIETALFRAALL